MLLKMFKKDLDKKIPESGHHTQWRIQDITDRGVPTYNLVNFPENCMKMRNLGPSGAHPSESATACVLTFNSFQPPRVPTFSEG